MTNLDFSKKNLWRDATPHFAGAENVTNEDCDAAFFMREYGLACLASCSGASAFTKSACGLNVGS
jgi:hypothetical protein